MWPLKAAAAVVLLLVVQLPRPTVSLVAIPFGGPNVKGVRGVDTGRMGSLDAAAENLSSLSGMVFKIDQNEFGLLVDQNNGTVYLNATNGTIDPNRTYYIFETVYPSTYSIPEIVIASVVVIMLMIVVVVGNMLVIIAIVTEKALKNVQNWFIASLAVADFFLGIIVMPFSLANELMGYWIFGDWWCDIHAALDVLLCTASIMNLCLIALDRYWSITQAVAYLKKRTPARAMVMIAFVWIFSGVICIPPLLGWKVKRMPERYPKCEVRDYIKIDRFESRLLTVSVSKRFDEKIFSRCRARWIVTEHEVRFAYEIRVSEMSGWHLLTTANRFGVKEFQIYFSTTNVELNVRIS